MVSRIQANPLPPVDRGHDTWNHHNMGDGNFPGGGHNYHQFTEWWADVSAQRAEASTSLAPAKPNLIENDNQPEVGNFFTPPEIVLYHNGLDSSQALRVPPGQRGGTTARGIPRRRGISSP